MVTTLTGTLGLNTARVAEVPSQAALEHHNNHLVLSSYLVPEFPDGSREAHGTRCWRVSHFIQTYSNTTGEINAC